MDSKIAIFFVLIGTTIILSHIGEGEVLRRLRRQVMQGPARWLSRRRA
ncbi:MAG TPA: hypothetical protein VFT69_15470 [Pseudolabrys sp.]|jgi:hypothetical protein|nr:hypothetical protein [Pseudolabrys sp.]